MSARRQVVLLLTCLALGTAANIVVATACLRWGWPDWNEAQEIDRTKVVWYWRHYAPIDWPAMDRTMCHRLDSVGATEYTMIAFDREDADFSYALTVMESGWPLRTLRSAMRNTSRSPLVLMDTWTLDLSLAGAGWSHVVVPNGPIWSGLLTNTLFYAAIAWLMIRGPWEARRRWREWHGKCGWCGYPCGASSVCTECGRPLPKRPVAAART